MGFLIRAALAVAPEQVRRVRPVRPGAARDLVARVYDQVVQDFGVLAPPVRLHSPAPGPLAACWVMLRESLLAAGLLNRRAREAVAAAVSLGNSCPYCVDVHAATLDGLLTGSDAVALSDDRISEISDPELRAVAGWAKASGTWELVERHDVPVPAEQVPELIAVAVTFQYYNRMANVFLGETPFPPGVPAAARGRVFQVFGRLMRPAASGTFEPGVSLELLPSAQLPPDLEWAGGDENLRDAFARAAAAIEEGGIRSVPQPVRALVLDQLDTWHGQPAGLSSAWVDDAISGLTPQHQPAARLALLVAMASYRVDDHTVAQFQATRSDDQSLVELAAWAALAASRRVGSWLWAHARLRLDPAA